MVVVVVVVVEVEAAREEREEGGVRESLCVLREIQREREEGDGRRERYGQRGGV